MKPRNAAVVGLVVALATSTTGLAGAGGSTPVRWGPAEVVSIDPSGTPVAGQPAGWLGPQFAGAANRYVLFNAPGTTPGSLRLYVRDRVARRTIPVDTGLGGVRPNGSSGFAGSISGNGRYVLFSSTASNLVRGDTNGKADVFIRDLQTSTTKRLSMTASGVQADDQSTAQMLTADGRLALFTTAATNLGGSPVLSRVADGALSFVRLPAYEFCGGQSTMSTDGHYVLALGCWAMYVRDRWAGTLTRVVRSAWNFEDARISGNGNVITWTGLNPAAPASGNRIAYVYDRTAGKTTEIARGYTMFNGTVSDDGRYIVLDSARGPLLYDRVTASTTAIPGTLLSGDGRAVLVADGDRLYVRSRTS